MNERIRELAEQAAGNFTETFKWDYLPEIDKDIFEKFAELIVRDCQDNLAWHGHDEAVSQLDWFKAHKLGIK